MKLFSKIMGGFPDDMIILHGLFGMSDNWNSLAKRFAKKINVHLLDLRNHGRSPHSEDFDYKVMTQDVFNYIQDYSLDKPIILGHSLGGKIAMNFAFSYPEKIKKLIVADISPREYDIDFHLNLLSILDNLPLQDFQKREEVDSALASAIKNKQVRLFLLKNLYRDENNMFHWRFNIKVLLRKLVNIKEADFIRGSCDVKTYFIKGEKSDYINDNDCLLIKKHFSDVEITSIEDAGHWLHAENPEAFYNKVIDCISE